jgi:hypothetical protein
MASRADFTNAEWKAMQKGVVGAGLLVCVSDPDYTDTFPEVGVLAMYLDEQREGSASELVRELAAVHVSGSGLVDDQKDAETEIFEALRTSSAVLGTKGPDEVAAYRELVMGAAAAVAEARSGVSPLETTMVAKLEAALGAA